MSNPFIWLLAILFTACFNPVHDKPAKNESVSENTPGSAQNTRPSRPDSLITGMAEMANIYSQAITEFVRAVEEKDQFKFDTLFLGNTFGGPALDLPATVSGVQIRQLAGAAIDQKKSVYSPSSPYINPIAFIENNKADFIFVTFYPEFVHQYDCYTTFRYNPEKKEFEVEKQRIEVLIRNKEGKGNHYAVYEKGKYVGDKAIENNKE